MKNKLVYLIILSFAIALFSGCSNQYKADKFNKYFSVVGKNVAELKRTNQDIAKIAGSAKKSDDFKGLDSKLDQEKKLLQRVIADYTNTKEPAELTAYKRAVIKNLYQKVDQVNILNDIIGYINKGDVKNAALQDELESLTAIEKAIDKNEQNNVELLKKIAADNKLEIKINDDKTFFSPAADK